MMLLSYPVGADQPQNNIDDVPGVTGIAASYNADDGYFVVLVASKDGRLEEIFYKPPSGAPNAPPTEHGRSVIGTFDGIRFVTGFYAKDDQNRIAIVATRDGDIHEVFYHPTRGRGESVIAHFDDIVGIAGFYNDDDKNRVVLVATADGNIHEVFYNARTGKGEDIVANYPSIRAISGHYDVESNFRSLVVATEDGSLHGLQYHPGQTRKTFVKTDAVGDTHNRVVSLASNTWQTDMVTSDGRLRRCRNSSRDETAGLTCWSDDQIADIRLVAITPDGPDHHFDVVYSTAKRTIDASALGGPVKVSMSNEVLHKFVPPTPVPPPPAPKITKFEATPDDYIPIGSSPTLHWTIDTCTPTCTVSLAAHHGLGYADLAFVVNGLPVSGSKLVTPTQTNTRYTLSASSAGGSDTKDLDVTWAPSSTPCAGCKVYFFKMTSASAVTPCFTIAIYAADEATAKTLAEGQNGGFTASSISEQDYYDGC